MRYTILFGNLHPKLPSSFFSSMFLFSIYLFVNFIATSHFCGQSQEIDIVLMIKWMLLMIARLNKINIKYQ